MLQPSQHGPYKGVDASSGVFYQPKGTVPRSSNLTGIARGALATCDGSSILAWDAGAIQTGFGKFTALDVFEPSGVQPYYLALMTAAINLGSPTALATTDNGAGGSLIAGHTYQWVVTALDGIGGESLPSSSISFTQGGTAHIVKLTWDGMPNAFAYNVYRWDVTAGTGYLLLTSSSLPIPQSSAVVPMSFSYVDDGTASTATPITLTSVTVTLHGLLFTSVSFVSSSPHGFKVGQNLDITGVTPSAFNSFGVLVTQIVSPTVFLARYSIHISQSSGTGGSASLTFPASDSTQQTALLEIPASVTPPFSYSLASNVVALFPATIAQLATPAVAGNVTNSPTQNVPIVASPNGLVPLTGTIKTIQGTSGVIAVILTDTGPPTLQVGDNVTVSGTGNYNGTYQVVFIDIFSGGYVHINLGTQPSSVVETSGSIQFALVSLSTTSSFFPSIGSTQQISFAANAGYDGSCIVRSGGGTSFIVYSAGASVLSASGGGTFGAAGVPVGAAASGPAYSTVNGGIVGLVSPVPQMAQFTNRMILALGNGIAPNYYPDATGTATNPAVTAPITAITVTTNGGGGLFITVTTSSAHGLTLGGNFLISGVNPSTLNGVAVVEQVVSTTQVKAWLFGTFGGSPTYVSGGLTTQSAQPLPNNYPLIYPAWQASTVVPLGAVWVPKTQPANHVVITCIVGGTTGSVEPSWANPSATGQVFPSGAIADGSAVWQETSYLAAPQVPGAAHLAVYSGCLFLFNTSPINTAGNDGPTVLRQSDVGNPFSWPPSNQDFLDKDDGQEGMGMGTYTIAAVGIPPQGDLFAFKNFSSYQISGLFNTANFDIQKIKTERGCSAPRTILFVPGFGIGRLTHLGISITDGVEDRLLSDQVRPYLFYTNDSSVSDITPADPNWVPLCCSALTANPPMYCTFIPVGFNGASGGALTRSLAFDLVQRSWSPIDFPFSLGTASQVLLSGSAPVTLLGGFQDGLIQRWQFGDQLWETGSGSPSSVAWSYRTPITASKNPDQRLFCQEIMVKAVNTHSAGPVTCTPNVDGVAQISVVDTPKKQGDLLMTFPVQATGNRFYADISGTGGIEIDADDFHVSPKKIGGRLVVA